MKEIEVAPLAPDRFEAIVPKPCMEEFASQLNAAREQLGSRVLWHVNSTETGGGVAEILQSVLGYLAGAGIETRWAVVDGNEEFFVVTKRIHNMLHNRPGDGEPLGEAEKEVYLGSLASDVGSLLDLVRSGDVVLLHDPQTLGLAEPLNEAGARVVWICHVGVDEPGETARAAWQFLMPHVLCCDAQVFTRPQYVWEGLDSGRVEIIPPCIDAFSPKNQPIEDGTVAAILDASAIVPDGRHGEPVFARQDGEHARVSSSARMFEDAPVPRDAPVVTQISRWDRLKDHRGVLVAFAEHVPEPLGAHLILAGPAPGSVEDDPEGRAVLEELVETRQGLAASARERAHIASLPMDDVDENATVVNALQRYSAVIVQKSLAEGFGLTVAEAMWKARPVVATRVGGIQDQIEDGETGVLVDDATDLPVVGRAVAALLEDREKAGCLARAGHESVSERYLVPRYLSRYLRLAQELVDSE